MSQPGRNDNAEPNDPEDLAEEARSGEIAPAHSRRWSDHPRYELRTQDPKYVDREPERHFNAQEGEDPTTAYGRLPPDTEESEDAGPDAPE